MLWGFGVLFSHYKYHGLVTIGFFFFTYILFFDIYMRCCMFSSPLSPMCCFFSIFMHVLLLVYNLSMFHTWCLDESCLSVSNKTSCKSIMPWSLLLQTCQEFVVGLDLYTFVNYGIGVLVFFHNCYLWFCHGLPKGEIDRVFFFW